MPDEDKEVIKKLLDAFLTKNQLQVLARLEQQKREIEQARQQALALLAKVGS